MPSGSDNFFFFVGLSSDQVPGPGLLEEARRRMSDASEAMEEAREEERQRKKQERSKLTALERAHEETLVWSNHACVVHGCLRI
jgi:hypothetical protein